MTDPLADLLAELQKLEHQQGLSPSVDLTTGVWHVSDAQRFEPS